jgi:hypothetical protein
MADREQRLRRNDRVFPGSDRTGLSVEDNDKDNE